MSSTTSSEVNEPVPTDHVFLPTPISDADVAHLRSLVQRQEPISIGTLGGAQSRLPPSAEAALRRLLAYLTAGRGVVVEGLAPLLTTQQVADILHVPRSQVIGLLQKGDIPSGPPQRGYPRIRLADLIDYQRRIQDEEF